MTTRKLAELREAKAANHSDASEWVRLTLSEFFTADEQAFKPRTASEVLDYLDKLDCPQGWRRLMRSETSAWIKRYALCRSALKSLAKRGLIATGVTTNALGNDRSTTYARRRDPGGAWELDIVGGTPEQQVRARRALAAWLSLEGMTELKGVSVVRLIRSKERG